MFWFQGRLIFTINCMIEKVEREKLLSNLMFILHRQSDDSISTMIQFKWKPKLLSLTTEAPVHLGHLHQTGAHLMASVCLQRQPQ